jgi:hypothetical protein
MHPRLGEMRSCARMMIDSRRTRAVAATVIVALISGACGSVPPTLPSPQAAATGTPAPASGQPSRPTQSTMPRPAVWAGAGEMPGVRGPEAFAALLLDGRVLVVGRGFGSTRTPSAFAADFGPEIKRWSATAGPALGIGSETLLVDGTVLVTGGGPSGTTAARYDPETGRWIPTEPMAIGRPEYSNGKDQTVWETAGYTATRLMDGRVLVAGGRTSQPAAAHPTVASNAELYDPVTGRWTTTGSMVHARLGHTATLLPNGQVLVVGGGTLGSNGDLSELRSAELFDPTTGTWTATRSLRAARAFHTATLLADGTVLIAGGDSPAGASTERYDPNLGRWTETGPMTVARSGCTATLLPDGTVLVAGGRVAGENGGKPAASAELYDPATGRWTATASMAGARAQHAAALLTDGAVLVAGGEKDFLSMHWLASSEIYHPGNRQ